MIAVRARSTVAIGYLMAQVLVLSPLLAVGGETPDIEKDLTPEEALHYDALDYAAAFDVSVEEAERRLVARYEFEAIRIEAIALAGDRFAGSWLEHSPEFQAVVLLTGNDRLSEVEQVVASPEAGGEVAVRYGARHSYRQLLGGLARLDPLVSDFPGASAGIDMSENTVAFGTSAVLDVATEDLLSTSAGVSVRFDRHPEVQLQHTWGGRSLSPPGCTTGFTAKTASNIKGVLSAAHCDNANNRYHQNADINYPMTVFYEYYDNDEDWEYVKEPNSVPNPHIVEPKFYGGLGYVTVLNGDAPSPTAMEGDFVCHYGRGSAIYFGDGRSCGIIDDATYDPGDICGGPCSAAFVRVVDSPSAELACAPGDSGGPWFGTSRAYGIHKAGTFIPPGAGTICVFTPTQRVDAHSFDILEAG